MKIYGQLNFFDEPVFIFNKKYRCIFANNKLKYYKVVKTI